MFRPGMSYHLPVPFAEESSQNHHLGNTLDKLGSRAKKKGHLDKRMRMTLVMFCSEPWTRSSEQLMARSWCSLSMYSVSAKVVSLLLAGALEGGDIVFLMEKKSPRGCRSHLESWEAEQVLHWGC